MKSSVKIGDYILITFWESNNQFCQKEYGQVQEVVSDQPGMVNGWPSDCYIKVPSNNLTRDQIEMLLHIYGNPKS